MAWIVIDSATGAIVADVAETEPSPVDGQEVVRVPIGYPARMAWSPTLRGFIDVAKPLYTFNQWVDLFSMAEQVAIVTATMSDPMAKLIYDRAQSASGSIDPTDPRTAEGLGYLVAQGYVEQATFDRIVVP